MRKLNFLLGDAGTYMLGIPETDTRWCIRHPSGSYSKNPSGLFDCYVVGLNERLPNDVKYLNSFRKLNEAKSFLLNQFKSKKDFYSLDANENAFYTKNYYFK